MRMRTIAFGALLLGASTLIASVASTPINVLDNPWTESVKITRTTAGSPPHQTHTFNTNGDMVLPSSSGYYPVEYTEVSNSSGGTTGTTLVGHYMNMHQLRNQTHIHGFQSNVTRMNDATGYGETLCYGGAATALKNGDLSTGIEVWAFDNWTGPPSTIIAAANMKAACFVVDKKSTSPTAYTIGVDSVASSLSQTGYWAPDVAFNAGGTWKTGMRISTTYNKEAVVAANDDCFCGYRSDGTTVQPLLKCGNNNRTCLAAKEGWDFWSSDGATTVLSIAKSGTINASSGGVQNRQTIASSWPTGDDVDLVDGEVRLWFNSTAAAFRLYFRMGGTVAYINVDGTFQAN